jgi:hypothetical protein
VREGKVTPVIDRQFTLDEVPEAIRTWKLDGPGGKR